MKSPLLILLTLALVAAPLVAQNARDDRRTISVSGEAVRYVAPDRAQVVIGVESDGKTVTETKQKNDERIAVLMKAIKDIGVKDADVQTSNLNIQPVYDHRSDDRRLIKYTMRNEVRITVKDLTKVEAIVNKGLTGAGNVLSELTFYREDTERYEDTLRVQAAMDAKRKATQLAEALGVAVGKPVTVFTRSMSKSPQVAYRGRNEMVSGLTAADDGYSSTEVQQGQIRIAASVDITFEIE